MVADAVQFRLIWTHAGRCRCQIRGCGRRILSVVGRGKVGKWARLAACRSLAPGTLLVGSGKVRSLVRGGGGRSDLRKVGASRPGSADQVTANRSARSVDGTHARFIWRGGCRRCCEIPGSEGI